MTISTRTRRRPALIGATGLTLTILLAVSGCSGASEEGTGGRAPLGGAAGQHGRAAPGQGFGGGGQAEERQPGRFERDSAYLSTFALDVDTASYSFARRRLLSGARPTAGTVRPEEFVNYFRQDYPEPAGNGFSLSADGARVAEREGSDVRLLRVGLRTRGTPAEERRNANLTFVVDTSGSMAEPGRLDLVQDSLHTLVNQLRPSDSVAIVAYGTQARLVRHMTPASDREALHGAIDSLSPEDSTNLEAGMVLGYREARRAFRPGATNRVILASDGIANVGNTEPEPILRKVGDEAGKGITLLCVGVGSDYGDSLMESLADKGDGMAVYVSERERARRLFVEQLPANLDLRARDAKAQVAFEPSAAESFRLIGYDNRALRAQDFRDDAVDGGEIGPGHTVTALYAVRLRPGAEGTIGTVSVRWQDPDTREPREDSRSMRVDGTAQPLWSARSQRLQVSAVAAFFAENLRDADPGVAGPEPDGGASGEPEEGTTGPSTAPVRSGPFVTYGRLAGEAAVGNGELAEHAARLAAATRDQEVSELASLIRRAGSAS
jgi:Ca-activated chloride channel family protein